MQRQWGWLVAIASFALVVLAMLGLWKMDAAKQQLPGFGDYFGGVLGTVFAAIGTGVLIWTLMLQRQEIKQSRSEVNKAVLAQQGQMEALKELSSATSQNTAVELTIRLHQNWVNAEGQTHCRRALAKLALRRKKPAVKSYDALSPAIKREVRNEWNLAAKAALPVLESWVSERLDHHLAKALFEYDLLELSSVRLFGFELDPKRHPDFKILEYFEQLPFLDNIESVDLG